MLREVTMISNREVVDTWAGTAVMEWQRPRGAIHTGGILSLPDPTKPSAPPINYQVSIFQTRPQPTDIFYWARVTFEIFDDCKGRSFDGGTGRTIKSFLHEPLTIRHVLDCLMVDSSGWRLFGLESGPTRTARTR